MLEVFLTGTARIHKEPLFSCRSGSCLHVEGKDLRNSIASGKLMCSAEILSQGSASHFSKPLSPTNLHYGALAC